MAKNKYETQLEKAVLQVLEGCDQIASIFLNHKVETEHKDEISEAMQARMRELKKQMEYVPPTQKFSLSKASDKKEEKKEEKKEAPKQEEKKDPEPHRPAGLGGHNTHGQNN